MAIEHVQGMQKDGLRADLAIISQWIKADTKVLDLGCGDGILLSYLRDQRNVLGYGLEINPFNIEVCVEKNINVIQANLNNGLKSYFSDHSFDCVIMSQTLQATEQPDLLIEEMLRVGNEGIVTFPTTTDPTAEHDAELGITPARIVAAGGERDDMYRSDLPVKPRNMIRRALSGTSQRTGDEFR